MKTVFTSQEIAHVWANQSAPHGRCPANMHFSGNKGEAFYSYNTVIARHVEHKGKKAIILNVTHYSPSTSNHQGGVRGAIQGHDVTVFRVDSQGYNADLRFSGDELFTHYIEQSAKCEARAFLPRIRQATRDSHKAQAAAHLESAKAVAAFYGLRKKVDEKAVQRLAASKAKAEKRAAAEAAKRDKAQREKELAAYEAWKRGEKMPEGEVSYFTTHLFPVAFRIEGEDLVSTLGARVPLQAARIARRFVLSKRGTGWHRNGETHAVGMYQIDAVNEHGIVAGCHRITWGEIERLEALLEA